MEQKKDKHLTIDQVIKAFRAEHSDFRQARSKAKKLAKKIAAANGFSEEYGNGKMDYKYIINMLVKICAKCIIDGFPIEEYCLFHIHHHDTIGSVDIVTWDNRNDYNATEIRCIDFWCQRNFDIAIPLGNVSGSDFTLLLEPFKTCAEAVYTVKNLNQGEVNI